MKEIILKIKEFLAQLPSKLKELYLYFIENLYIVAEKSKDLIKTNYELGLYHLDKGNIHDAKFRLYWVAKLKPDHELAHYNLARCYIYEAKLAKAKEHLEAALKLNAKLEAAKYRLDLLNHSLKQPKILTQVVKEDYNSSAKTYEKYSFEQMNYQAPLELFESIKEYLNEDSEILDIGCGTGALGIYLKDHKFKYLTGIDISENMLELAKEISNDKTPTYTETKVLDFNDLSSLEKKFNLITACMSFGYANDLDAVIKSLTAITEKGAILALTVLKADKIEFNYELGAICYSKDFLESILTNWKILESKEVEIYNNCSGLLFVLSRK